MQYITNETDYDIVDDVVVYFNSSNLGTVDMSTHEVYNSCAKKIVRSKSGNTDYYVKTIDGRFVDPFVEQPRHADVRWKHVNKDIFDIYVKFLETRKKAHLMHAERMGG